MKTLDSIVSQIIVVAHKEDTSCLERSLKALSAPIKVQRLDYTEEELDLPAIYRCLLNHEVAWEEAAKQGRYTLICEADFIPIKDFSETNMQWLPDAQESWAHLYTCSPRIIRPFDGYFRVQQATMVCYIINSYTAAAFRGFTDHYRSIYGAKSMATWDAMLQWYAMGKGAEMYIPPKSLGEHGGWPNPEHSKAGMNHFGMHRADALAGPLEFIPPEFQRKLWLYKLQRAYFWTLAIGRIFIGKWIEPVKEYKWSLSQKIKANYLGLIRLF